MPNLQLACTYIKSLILILSLLKNNKIQVWIKSLKTATQETFILIIIIVGGWVTSKTNNNWVNKLCYMLYQLKNTDSTIFALKKIDFCIKTRFSRSSQSYQDILVGGRIKKKNFTDLKKRHWDNEVFGFVIDCHQVLCCLAQWINWKQFLLRKLPSTTPFPLNPSTIPFGWSGSGSLINPIIIVHQRM